MSAKRSNTQRSRQATFLLDENTSSDTLAIRLREVPGWTIEMHADHLHASAPDEEVVTLCGQKGWGLLTFDEMRYTEDTKRAIKHWNTRIFKVITHEETHFTKIVSALVIGQTRMLEIMHKNKLACCAHVYSNGEVAIVTQFADIPPGLTPQQVETFLKYGKLGR